MIPGVCFMSIFFAIGGLTGMCTSEEVSLHTDWDSCECNSVGFSVRCKSNRTVICNWN